MRRVSILRVSLVSLRRDVNEWDAVLVVAVGGNVTGGYRTVV